MQVSIRNKILEDLIKIYRMSKTTILDMLNEDCWRLVLHLLHIEDIIRSERVSRGWQHVILRYLQEACFSIEYPWYSHKVTGKYHILKMEEDDLEKLATLTGKWGPCVRKADCVSAPSLKVLRRNCPNLEDVTFYGLQNGDLSNRSPKTFKHLKRVQFRGCESVRAGVPRRYLVASNQCFAFCGLTAFIFKYYFTNSPYLQVTDKCIKHWLGRDSIQELVVWGTERVTGQFLSSPLTSKLKSLCLKECEALEFRHLHSSIDHLKNLRKLQLIYVPKQIFLDVHLLLDQLPDLEDLCLRWEKKMEMGEEWAESVGRLRLRRLDVRSNPNVSDEWLQTAARGFGRLGELLLEGCLGVSSRGVLSACGASSETMRGLSIASIRDIKDHHVEEILSICPNLEWLDVTFCWQLTDALVVVAARGRERGRGRGRRLRLALANTAVEEVDQEKYPWLHLVGFV